MIASHARVVIVGGGIAGTGVAYHLTKLGWKNVVLFEQGSLTVARTAERMVQLERTEGALRHRNRRRPLLGAWRLRGPVRPSWSPGQELEQRGALP